jgi:hypothetical protein
MPSPTVHVRKGAIAPEASRLGRVLVISGTAVLVLGMADARAVARKMKRRASIVGMVLLCMFGRERGWSVEVSQVCVKR